jgi:hypothetical protein
MNNNQQHPWDLACKLEVLRESPPLFCGAPIYEMGPIDPGMNFFVLALEELGCTPKYSCEGHPFGAYISFDGPEEIARAIHGLGHFYILGRNKEWVWNAKTYENCNDAFDFTMRTALLRVAAEAWMCRFEDRLPKLRKMLGMTN